LPWANLRARLAALALNDSLEGGGVDARLKSRAGTAQGRLKGYRLQAGSSARAPPGMAFSKMHFRVRGDIRQ